MDSLVTPAATNVHKYRSDGYIPGFFWSDCLQKRYREANWGLFKSLPALHTARRATQCGLGR